MKKEVPTWLVVVAIALVVALVAAWLWQGTSKGEDVVVEKTFGDESNPFGNQAPPRPQTGTGASGP
ncbi:MAG: hypothetical protein ACUVV1_00890 [Fimbriimonadales bacterium]